VTLRNRLERLEAKRGSGDVGPNVIFFCAPGGEPSAALILGGGTVTRNEGETVEAFTARASAGVSGAVCLPDNGRDAIATGKAPAWAQSALAMRHLRAKHGGGGAGPEVIFRCDAITGEAFKAIIPGQGRFVRHDGESVVDFKQRIAGDRALP